MAVDGFEMSTLYRKSLPVSAARFDGLPKYNFTGGQGDPECVPVQELAAAAGSVILRKGQKLALYNMGEGPQGYNSLREFIVNKLTHRQINCNINDILVTSGSAQGIELLCDLFLDSGDTVLVEEFSFQGIFGTLKEIGAKIVGIPVDNQGIIPQKLEEILLDLRSKGVSPKFLYTIPTVQNPTGTIMPIERRIEILAIARKFGFVIFEDECYADLSWNPTLPACFYGLDEDIVVHIGSFSKTLAPALRVGYLLAKESVILQILPLKKDGGTGAVDQLVAGEFLAEHFDAHAASLKVALKEKLDVLVDSVEREFGVAAEAWVPEGGIFMWVKLHPGIDSRALVAPAAKAGIAFNAGSPWAADAEQGANYIRLCFALPSTEEIREGIAAFAQVCFETTGLPLRSGNTISQ